VAAGKAKENGYKRELLHRFSALDLSVVSRLVLRLAFKTDIEGGKELRRSVGQTHDSIEKLLFLLVKLSLAKTNFT
jgi:hypothetical protein